jgi:hypothetical protein
MRIPVSSIVDYQLPAFVREEYPLFSEFLKQYYLSDTSEILVQNLDKNLDLDVIFNLKSETVLTDNVGFNDTTIFVESTTGFSDLNGLIKIDDEIILYTSKTENSFIGCVRGFSGISKIDKQFLEFSETELETHSNGSQVLNLSNLYLQQFALHIKKQISPGFEERNFFTGLNASNFVKNIKSFYNSKGSDESFRILFGALYGKNVDVIKPRDFLIRPSDAQYRVTKDLVVEVIQGDPYKLINSTVYQDQTDFIELAQGTVVEVTKLIRKNKEYYIISLDFDYNRDVDVSGTVKSEFSIHPKTLSTSKITSGSSYIDVDSTVGFPDKGELKIDLKNGTTFMVSYQSKVLNQFLDCSNISFDIPEKTEIKINNSIYGIDIDGNLVTMFVTGVLGDIEYLNDTFYYKKNEKIKIDTLGSNVEGLKANNWFFNVSVTYGVQTIELGDISNFSYKVSLFDPHSFVIGDSFTLYSTDGLEFNGKILFIENEKVVVISGQGQLNTQLKYTIRKNISKVDVLSPKYANLRIFNSNIQNIYTDYSNSIYVSSPSLPTYLDFPLEINDFTLKVPAKNYTELSEIEFVFNHGLFTGDSIIYRPINDDNKITNFGVYFVYKVTDRKIKLSRSLSDIDQNVFITFNGEILPGFESEIEPAVFNDDNFTKLPLRPQNIIKKLESPKPATEVETTEPGPIGIFINGVEISNFKSDDSVFYGAITNVDIINNGNGYSVLNPPKITVSDPIGFGASLVVGVEGSLDRIDVIDPGFDYTETPVISISGGGGVGAQAVAELVSFTHSSDFNSESSADFTNNTLEFNFDHKFNNNEEVIYRTYDQKAIVGLDTNSKYFVGVLDSRKIKLYFTLDDSSVGINTVNLSGIGTGIHSLQSVNPKKKVSNIEVINPGSGYKNKRLKVSGINTASDSLTIINHGYSSGEIIQYFPSGNSIGGLFSNASYYVSVVDNNTIKLSGISTDNLPDSNYRKNKYVDIISEEPGEHYFNYPEIKVELLGKIGISTLPDQDLTAKIQPVFSGKITSVFIENPGQKYGSEDIINFEKKPVIEIESGRNAQVTPVISNGTISRVVVNSPGTGYQQIPELIITPSQNGAVLTPVVSNGKLVEVVVINGGSGFNQQDTLITIVPKGEGVKFNANIKSRRINIVEKLIKTNNITRDDGYLTRSIDSLEYTHLYSPRALRQSVLRKLGNSNVKDLIFSFGQEQRSIVHSPLIGWAYDGNPIYGPYGYSNGNSGSVKALKSSYDLKSESQLISENRPSFDLYPLGFFIDDYAYTGNRDLDEHNGRYCITPEFPNGTYAYFCTVSDIISDTSSPFLNYYSPTFPYIIGPTFKNKLIQNISRFDSLGNKILRNTTPYNLLNKKSGYEFILDPTKIKEESLEIVKTTTSTVDNISIIESGLDYKVDDSIVLTDNTIAKVEKISGMAVTSIDVSYDEINDVEVIPFKNSYIGVSTNPHNISTVKKFEFNSDYELNKKILAIPYTNRLTLSSKVDPTSITGIITYFSINENLNFPLKENDIFTINEEKIKILNIDPQSSRIRVEREQFGTTGISTYNVNSILVEDSRKLTFNLGISTYYNFKLNKEFYFDPNETLGIGTIGNHTLNIGNPGLGLTIITIPVKSLYIKNHELNSGDSIFYSSNGNSPIEVSSNGIGSTTLFDNDELFVTKINNDLISISTQRTQVGDLDNSLFLTSSGTGSNHSFKTNYSNILVGNITKNTVNVSTASSHRLTLSDNISINVVSGIKTEYNIFYNDYNRRLCVNKRNVESVDILKNKIISTNHKLEKGEKVIYVSTSPISGLINQKIYYVVPITKNSFKLVENYYDTTENPIKEVELTSSGSGYFYSINPKITITKDQDIEFIVSDSTLSFNFSGQIKSAFELKLYSDKDLLNEYPTFDLIKTGEVGISSNAKYLLKTSNLPDKIYYSFKPINTEFLSENKKNIYLDTEQLNCAEIVKENSLFSGEYKITSITPNTFSYEIDKFPERTNYLNTNSKIEYSTDSSSATGPIRKLKITNFENSNTLPQVKQIISENGRNALLEPTSLSIGSIERVKKLDIGFDYSVDYTIRPKANIPKIIKLEPLYQLDSINTKTRGFGYTYAPDLILINGSDRTPFPEAILEYNLENTTVKITENTTKIKNSDIEIIPTNNDNGFEIDELTYDVGNKIVTVTLKTTFNDILDFPFIADEYVYIENVPIISDLNSKGYNSSNYGYRSFKIIDSSPNIGGVGATFSYIIGDLIDNNSIPGVVDNFYTSGFAIPKSYIPTFEAKIKPNQFFKQETIRTTSGSLGEVIDWDEKNSIIKVIIDSSIKVGDTIYGETSKTYCKIIDIYSPKSYIDIESNSVVNKGWSDKTGFLNDPLQRIHDSDYYQYFSYDLRSEVSYTEWSDPVDSLNHTAGFKKFGNILINSTHDNVGINTSQSVGGVVEVINDLQTVIDVNCVSDFDLVTENYFSIDNSLKSNEIYFNSRRLQNYIESIGNKVILIDDISDKFKPVIPETETIIDIFNKFQFRFKKYLIHVLDRINTFNSQVIIVNLLHNDNIVGLTQYGLMDSITELGYFDAKINGLNVEVSFSPIITSNKLYSVNSFSYNISDLDEGAGNLSLGDVVEINSNRVSGIGTTTITKIPSSKTASKIIIVYSDLTNNSYYSDEINYVHDGINIISNAYGELNLGKSSGIGTYSFVYDGPDISVQIHPNEQFQYDINSISIELSDTSSTSTGSLFLSGNKLQSTYVGVTTAGSPQKTKLYFYENNYTSGIHQILITDTSNNKIYYNEILTMLNSSTQETYSVEFGELKTKTDIGEFEVEYSSLNGDLEIYFTPYQDIDYQVRMFSTLTSKFRRSETLEV